MHIDRHPMEFVIRTILTEQKAARDKWVDLLSSALFSYRTSIHSTTGCRPCYLFFQFRAKDFLPRPTGEDENIFPNAAKRIAHSRWKHNQRF